MTHHVQRTLAIVKPDAVEQRVAGKVIARIEAEGFRIAALRMVRLGMAEAEGFYAVHRGKPFFASLTSFMSSGPAIVVVLEREDAISRWREIMGSTNPSNAAPGTLRKELATSVERNVVHGSDAPETAAFEIAYFFGGVDLLG
ncbi:MAG: nucleoside-diphosphate kinase [Acidobacteriia bacterium]|nr:nucleoside-diphosphate kinase [Terriglobia bacterium]